MKRKIVFYITLMILLFSFSGCSKIIKSETKEIKAKIVSTYYEPAKANVLYEYETGIFTTDSENWSVILSYNNQSYHIRTEEAYNLCKNYEGSYALCNFIVNYYEDDTKREYISSVKEILE